MKKLVITARTKVSEITDLRKGDVVTYDGTVGTVLTWLGEIPQGTSLLRYDILLARTGKENKTISFNFKLNKA